MDAVKGVRTHELLAQERSPSVEYDIYLSEQIRGASGGSSYSVGTSSGTRVYANRCVCCLYVPLRRCDCFLTELYLVSTLGMTDRRVIVSRRFYTDRTCEGLLSIASAMLGTSAYDGVVSVVAINSGNYRWVLRFPGLPALRQRFRQ